MRLEVDAVAHHASFKEPRGKVRRLVHKHLAVHVVRGLSVLQDGPRVAGAAVAAGEVSNNVALALKKKVRDSGELRGTQAPVRTQETTRTNANMCLRWRSRRPRSLRHASNSSTAARSFRTFQRVPSPGQRRIWGVEHCAPAQNVPGVAARADARAVQQGERRPVRGAPTFLHGRLKFRPVVAGQRRRLVAFCCCRLWRLCGCELLERKQLVGGLHRNRRLDHNAGDAPKQPKAPGKGHRRCETMSRDAHVQGAPRSDAPAEAVCAQRLQPELAVVLVDLAADLIGLLVRSCAEGLLLQKERKKKKPTGYQT